VAEEAKQERYDRLMQSQQSISIAMLAARVGETIEVVVIPRMSMARWRAYIEKRARSMAMSILAARQVLPTIA
jgi:tRNA A37 methylthiotransferase MiaB